ncbi:protein of unknown function [Petrocella atlantisensis]|uniref:CzcB-like C-terminal circularly permuted SH3-like domain-containing protein n=1 Tax=Petrocella atlantisensis TaxID=2173034 RepID=A0A3P7RZD0_9FIRM|nr:HlyD family efflux transporter periplasmic adaptor subunit [Petrocella atlantisensis]VDN48036.1 protein of unknown function [Petrocella atlantisensis]
MKRKYLYLVVSLVLIGGIFWYMVPKNTAEGAPVEVIEEVKVTAGDVLIDFIADGNVRILSKDQFFNTSGVLEALYFDVGDVVAKGDLLAKLSTDDLALKIKQTEIAINTEIERQKESITNHTYDIQMQEAIIESLTKELQREMSLLETMATYPSIYTPNEHNDQLYKKEQLEATLDSEKNELQKLKNESQALNNLLIDDKKVILELLKLDLEKAYLYADTDGVIGTIHGVVNTSIGTTNAFLTILDQEQPMILSMVSELDIGQVTLGQKVLVELESDYGMTYEGRVSWISMTPTIDNNGIVSYEVEIILEKYPDTIRSGLSALLHIVLKERLDVLVIPNSAVKIVNNQQVVEVKVSDQIQERIVVTGLTDGVNVEVIQGLEEGETLIVRSLK